MSAIHLKIFFNVASKAVDNACRFLQSDQIIRGPAKKLDQ